MFQNTIIFYLINFLLQTNYIFPNKNASIAWNNNEYYNLNLSVIDNNLNQILNQEIGINQTSPFIWNVPNFINNFTYYNKNLLFIKNHNIIESKNINNFGVLISKQDEVYNLKSNYNCEYFNLTLDENNIFTIYDNDLILENNYFGVYDITITSNDNKLFIYDQLDFGSREEEDTDNFGFMIFKIIMLSICGLSVLVCLYLVYYYFIYVVLKLCGINLYTICRRKKNKFKNRIYPEINTSYNPRLRRRLSTTDVYMSKNNNFRTANNNDHRIDLSQEEDLNNVFI